MTKLSNTSRANLLLLFTGKVRNGLVMSREAQIPNIKRFFGISTGEHNETYMRKYLCMLMFSGQINPFSASSSGTQQLLAPAVVHSDSGTKRAVTIFKRP